MKVLNLAAAWITNTVVGPLLDANVKVVVQERVAFVTTVRHLDQPIMPVDLLSRHRVYSNIHLPLLGIQLILTEDIDVLF